MFRKVRNIRNLSNFNSSSQLIAMSRTDFNPSLSYSFYESSEKGGRHEGKIPGARSARKESDTIHKDQQSEYEKLLRVGPGVLPALFPIDDL